MKEEDTELFLTYRASSGRSAVKFKGGQYNRYWILSF